MEEVEFLRLVGSRARRTAEYRSMVVAYYDRVTDAYRAQWGDFFHLPLFQTATSREDAILGVERFLVRQIAFRSETRVLDVGCGIGGTAIYLAKHFGAHITGVNISPSQVEIARQRAAAVGLSERTDFRVGDAMDLQLPESSFDAVITVESCCHMPDKERFFRTCTRLLRREGIYVGVDWMQRDGLSEHDEELLIEPVCRLHGLTSLVDITRLRCSMEASGLEVDRIEDLTHLTGLLDAPLPTPVLQQRATAFGSQSTVLPTPEEWLNLGGVALTWAAHSGAFLVAGWRARRSKLATHSSALP